MITILILLFAFFPAFCFADGTCSSSTCNGTSPWTASSASYDDVDHCVNICAGEGEVVYVPEGDYTWTDTLMITKGIKLIGAGKTKTKITSNITDSDMLKIGLIQYVPSIPSTDHAFRLSGFTFDCNDTSDCITLTNSTSTPETIRIDNNTFKNPGGEGGRRAIDVWGTFYGVIDSNDFIELTFGTDYDVAIAFQGSVGTKNGKVQWDAFGVTRTYGGSDNLFVEHNIFSPAHGNTIMHGQGGKSVIRYNSFQRAAGNLLALIDMHGNQSAAIPSNYGTLLSEVYGNSIDFNGYNGYTTDQRGGMALIFYNYLYNGDPFYSGKVREEYNDATIPEANPYIQRVTNTYYFTNRQESGMLSTYLGGQCSDGCEYIIAENTDYWTQRTGTFDGTGASSNGGGVGCGTLANLPATCTTGVAYWATNQKCDDLTGMVGANPATPISGTLYKCTSTDTWEPYYTPYTYPHPLRVQKFTGNVMIGGAGLFN